MHWRPSHVRAISLIACVAGCPSAFAQDAGVPSSIEDERQTLVLLFGTEGVVDTPAKAPTPVVEAPGIVQVISGAQLRRSGVLNLAEALDRLAGVTMVRDLGGGMQPVIRGAGSADGVLVLLDGVPLNDDLDGRFAFYELDLAEVDRVEIVTGPGSALYGGRALLALIQIFTLPEEFAPHYLVAAGGGTLSSKRARIELRDKVSKFGVRLAGAWWSSVGTRRIIDGDFVTRELDRKRFNLPPVGFDPLAPTQRDSPQELGHLSLAATRGGLEASAVVAYGRGFPVFTYLGSLPTEDGFERVDFLAASAIRYRYEPSDTFALTPHVGFSLNRRLTGGSLTGPVAINRDNDLNGQPEVWPDGWREERHHSALFIGADVEADWRPVEWNTATAGFSVEEHTLEGVSVNSNILQSSQFVGEVASPRAFIQTGQRFVEPDLNRQVVSAYAQDFLRIKEFASVIAGLRWDHYSDFGDTVNPRAGVWVAPLQTLNAKLLVGRAFKPPTFLATGDLTPTDRNARQRQGNPDLRPTTVLTWEGWVGYRRGTIDVGATLFHSRVRDEVILDTNSQSFVNGAERLIRGGTLEATIGDKTANFASANYTLQLVDGGSSGFLAPIYPKHRVNVWGSWLASEHLDLGAALRFRSATEREPDDPRDDLDAFATVDLRAGVRDLVPHTRFELRIMNVTDADVRDPMPLDTGITGDWPRDGFRVMALMEMETP